MINHWPVSTTASIVSTSIDVNPFVVDSVMDAGPYAGDRLAVGSQGDGQLVAVHEPRAAGADGLAVPHRPGGPGASEPLIAPAGRRQVGRADPRQINDPHELRLWRTEGGTGPTRAGRSPGSGEQRGPDPAVDSLGCLPSLSPGRGPGPAAGQNW